MTIFGNVRLAPPSRRTRRELRDPCDLVTSITRGTELRIGARIVDISTDGCCVRSDRKFARDDRIRILLPVVGDIEAHVVWTLQGVFGAVFRLPIDHGTYSRVLAAIKTRRDTWPGA